MQINPMRLGVNIDHVATIRNARGGKHPQPTRAAKLAQVAGADSITIHLREDRRHITDSDVFEVANAVSIPINLEMAAVEEIRDVALKLAPHAVCLVPERRQERTTEGGLDADGNKKYLKDYVKEIQDNGTRVSLFIEPSEKQVNAAAFIGAKAIEFHTGHYCDAFNAGDMDTVAKILKDLQKYSKLAVSYGIDVHAGHGITYDSVADIAKIPEISELNIGHFLIGEAIFVGLEASIKQMRSLIDDARKDVIL